MTVIRIASVPLPFALPGTKAELLQVVGKGQQCVGHRELIFFLPWSEPCHQALGLPGNLEAASGRRLGQAVWVACQPEPALAPAVSEVPQGVSVLSHDTEIVPHACLGCTWPLHPHSGHCPLWPPPPDSSLGVLVYAQALSAVPCCSQFCLGGPFPSGNPQPRLAPGTPRRQCLLLCLQPRSLYRTAIRGALQEPPELP